MNKAFPASEVKAYGKGLFVSVEEAIAINETSKRTRFFTKKEEVIKIKGGKIAVTNQIDAALVKRILVITAGMKYVIKTIEAPAKEVKEAKEVKPKTVVIIDVEPQILSFGKITSISNNSSEKYNN